MKSALLFLCCALLAPLFGQSIEWQYGDKTEVKKAAEAQKIDFDHLKPYATLAGKDPKVIYTGIYVLASIEDGKLVGAVYYINPQGFLGFGLNPDAQKLAAILPVERVEFCFPVEKGKWHPIKFKTKHQPPACAIRVVD